MNAYNGFPPAQRSAALKWLKGEYAAGRRHRPTVCDACGQTKGIIEAHSEDYSSPFGDHIGAYGLCYVCHMMVHCRFTAPLPWQQYRARVLSGWMPAPAHGRDWGRIREILGGADAEWQQGDGEHRPFLDMFGPVEGLHPPPMF